MNWKNDHLDMKFVFYLALGSLPGAFLGVQINVAIPDLLAEGLLYLFVLFAGISIILRTRCHKKAGGTWHLQCSPAS